MAVNSKAGWDIECLTSARVIHVGGDSARSDGQLSMSQPESELLNYRKHNGLRSLLKTGGLRRPASVGVRYVGPQCRRCRLGRLGRLSSLATCVRQGARKWRMTVGAGCDAAAGG